MSSLRPPKIRKRTPPDKLTGRIVTPVYVPKEVLEKSRASGISCARIYDICQETLKNYRAAMEEDIKGILTPEEWMYVINGLRGKLVHEILRFSPQTLTQIIKDHYSSRDIDVPQTLIAKLSSLTRMQTRTVHSHANRFWKETKQKPTPQDYAKWCNI